MRLGSLVRSSTAILFAALACSGGGPAGPGGGGGNGCLTSVGPSGGTVCLGTQVSVVFPAGAVSQETAFTITPTGMPADLALEGGIGQAYRISPSVALAVPARVTIQVPASALGGRSIQEVTLRRSTTANALAPAGLELTGISRTDDAVSGNTSSFGVFAAALLAPPNAAPTANAGADQSVNLPATVNLSGSATDPDGDTVDFSWAFVSRPAGSAATLTNPTSATPSFVADLAGTYDIRLTVNDGHGHTDTDDVRVVVAGPVNQAPVAVAGPDQNVFAGAVVVLNGNGSTDPDGTALTFHWEFVSRPAGSAATLQNSGTSTPTFTADVAGTYEVRLTVSDGQLTSTDTILIAATQQNRAPILNLSAPSAIFIGEEAAISAGVSDPDGDAVTVEFLLLTAGATLTVNGSNATLAAPQGAYSVRITASDGELTIEAEISILVNPHVDGAYAVTVFVDPTSCGDDQETQTEQGTLNVQQPSPEIVILDLPSASSDFLSAPDGTLSGESFFYNGPVSIRNGGSVSTLTGSIFGTLTASGEMNLSFNFPVFGTCRVVGTITGQK